jgi:hypothetical protein
VKDAATYLSEQVLHATSAYPDQLVLLNAPLTGVICGR